MAILGDATEADAATPGAHTVLVVTASALFCFEGYGSFQRVLKDHDNGPPIQDRVLIELDDGGLLLC